MLRRGLTVILGKAKRERAATGRVAAEQATNSGESLGGSMVAAARMSGFDGAATSPRLVVADEAAAGSLDAPKEASGDQDAPATVSDAAIRASTLPIVSASSLSQRLDEQLRRLTRVVQATNQRQIEVIEKLQAVSETAAANRSSQAPITLPAELTTALAALPGAMQANTEIPGRTVAALERIESLASTIRSHQQLQRRAADDLTGMREDLRKTLGTIERAVGELTELHRVSMNHVAELAASQREMLVGHHRHMAEVSTLRDQIRLEFAEEHSQRQSEHERSVRKSSRRISMAMAAMCVTTLIAALISSGSLSRVASSSSAGASSVAGTSDLSSTSAVPTASPAVVDTASEPATVAATK